MSAKNQQIIESVRHKMEQAKKEALKRTGLTDQYKFSIKLMSSQPRSTGRLRPHRSQSLSIQSHKQTFSVSDPPRHSTNTGFKFLHF
jgi:hypothetical protein